jgi:hypothetical protein
MGGARRDERREMHTKCWSQNLNGRGHVDGRIILGWISQKYSEKV